MDPKALSHLDPKQREAYERVMGTAAEIHADPDMNTPVDTSEPSILSNEDPLAQNPPSTPFDTSVEGLSTPQSIDPSPTMETPDLSAPTGEPDASPSIFTNNASEPDPTQIRSTPDAGGSTDASFFTSAPMPSPTETEPAPNLASPEGFPPVQSADTIASDNLAPVTPYVPAAADTPAPTPTMAEPFNTQPLPSPAEVGAATHKESSPLLRVLYIVGAVIFFAIYTIFWVKVFNLPFIF